MATKSSVKMSRQEAGRKGAEARWGEQEHNGRRASNSRGSSYAQNQKVGRARDEDRWGKIFKRNENHESQTLENLFLDELADMYNSENQIVESLPKLIKLASFSDLKEALSKHLKETHNQIERIENIFSLLDLSPQEKSCEAMEGILKEADRLAKNKRKGAVLDAAIISAAQKVEHYEIASYGTLYSFAKYLKLDDEVLELINEILEEEKTADKTLTKIAEGSMFTNGVNQDAAANYVKSRR